MAVLVPPPAEVKQQSKHNTYRFRGQAGLQLGAYRKNCTRTVVCSSGSPASRSQQHRTNITSRFRGQVGSPTRGLQKKQHHARKVCTVPGRFQSQTLGRSTKFSLSAHFTSGLELVALPRWLAMCACGSPSGSRGLSVAVFTLAFLVGGSAAGSLGFSASRPAAPSLSDGLPPGPHGHTG